LSGRADKPSWRLLGVAAASVVVLVLPPRSGADRSHALGQLRAENADLTARTRSAVLDLYSLDVRLDSARAELGALQARAQRLEAERVSIDGQLRLASLDNRLSQDRVASRLRYLYDYGTTTSSLDVLLGSSSLEEALTRLDDVDEVSAANEGIIIQLRSARSHLADLSQELAQRKRTLTETTRETASTVASLDQAQAQRSAYITGLEDQTAYNASAIDRLTAEAQAAEERSQLLSLERARAAEQAQRSALALQATRVQPLVVSPPQGAGPSDANDGVAEDGPALSPAGGAQAITVVATGYDLAGRTATGLPVGYGVAAVDPSVIPLGAHMSIPGYGEAVAADTGGAISGTRIDLWFPTAAQADAWGRRTVTIVVDG
jgi:3D (Asp-Asp-Asp) domain-containing protein/peptidoglycan hydrolase CwlO-like protein